MADDNALRSTLEELKALQDPDEGRERPKRPAPAKTEPPGAGEGGSLLADLLHETGDAARRELDDIKAQLAEKKATEEATKQRAEEERRRQLDVLRAQESARREQMIRERERKLAPKETVEQLVKPAAQAPAARVAAPPPPKKSQAMVWVVGVLGAAAIGVAAWYVYALNNPPPTEAVEEPAVSDNAPETPTTTAGAPGTSPTDEAGPTVAPTAAPTPTPAPEPAAVAAVELPVEPRAAEPEADPFPRWGLELKITGRPTAGRRGTRGKGKGSRGGSRGGHRIKIKGLDLSGTR